MGASVGFGLDMYERALNNDIQRKQLENQQEQQRQATQVMIDNGSMKQMLENPQYQQQLKKQLAFYKQLRDQNPEFAQVIFIYLYNISVIYVRIHHSVCIHLDVQKSIKSSCTKTK